MIDSVEYVGAILSYLDLSIQHLTMVFAFDRTPLPSLSIQGWLLTTATFIGVAVEFWISPSIVPCPTVPFGISVSTVPSDERLSSGSGKRLSSGNGREPFRRHCEVRSSVLGWLETRNGLWLDCPFGRLVTKAKFCEEDE